jgi:hypothetical protein
MGYNNCSNLSCGLCSFLEGFYSWDHHKPFGKVIPVFSSKTKNFPLSRHIEIIDLADALLVYVISMFFAK